MSWHTLLSDNLNNADQLCETLHLSSKEKERIQTELDQFPMSVPKYYFSLIDKDDPNDPIRKMSIPSGDIIFQDGELDTSGEHSNTKLQGLQHKYAQTVLVLTTSNCAMYCRFCFRRRLVGLESEEIAQDIGAVVSYITQHPQISNVLLSGGDSFLMTTERIKEWLQELTALDQLDFIRFGTRTPVTFPQRILTDPELLQVLETYGKKKQLYVVTHFNHPKEITEESKAAVKALQNAGLVVKNQTVLMRGINDDPEVLAALLKKLTSIGVVPHYLFQCRPVKGVKSHFQVPLQEGFRITQAALALQNGLGKGIDYTMSHVTGKIRILDTDDNGRMLFQYKQAKNPKNIGRIFSLDIQPDQTWLPDQIELSY